MAGRRVQRAVRRRKKRGMALVISYLIRAAIAAVVLLAVGLAVLAVRMGLQDAPAGPQDSAADASVSRSEPGEDEVLPAVAIVSGVVTLDPGHGGVDPGCGEEGALEKDIVLAITRLTARELERAGVTVVMTRSDDTGLTLDKRADIANAAGSDLFVSIHCNSFEGQASGLECYYYKSEPGRLLAQEITDAAKELGIKTRAIRENNYQVLWDTDMTAVLVETGFLTDPEERALLITPAYQEKVAQAIARAVVARLQQGQVA